jgi:hypothetical protein
LYKLVSVRFLRSASEPPSGLSQLRLSSSRRRAAALKSDEEFDAEQMEALVERLTALPEQDQAILRPLLGYFIRAHRAAAQEAQGVVSEAEGLTRVIDRARELDPEFPDSGTVRQAIAVLEAHGEESGVAEETLRKAYVVPPPAAAADA